MQTGRRQLREIAFQFLYAAVQNGWAATAWTRDSFQTFCVHFGYEANDFSWTLVDTVRQNLPQIDGKISTQSAHWKLERMPRVDLTVLRLATAELLYFPDTPKTVVINEAIELVKRFGAEDSGSFVNGLLDKIGKTEPASID